MRQFLLPKIALPIFLCLVSLIIDYKSDDYIFNNLSEYYPTIVIFGSWYLFYSLFLSKVVISQDTINIYYPFVSYWRKKTVLISDIIEFRIVTSAYFSRMILIQSKDGKKQKMNLVIIGFTNAELILFIDRLRNHSKFKANRVCLI